MERKKVKADLEEGSSNSADPQIEDVLRLGLATGEGVLPATSSPNSAGEATTTIGFFQPLSHTNHWNLKHFLQWQWEAGSMRLGWHATILTTPWFWVQGSSRMISTCRLVYHYTWRDNFCFFQIEWILVVIILQVCGGLGHSHRMSGITLLSVNDSKEFKKWNALSLPSVYRQEYVCAKFFLFKMTSITIFLLLSALSGDSWLTLTGRQAC